MPRLKCTFAQFIAILRQHDFEAIRQEGSHARYRAERGGKVWLVTVAGSGNTDIKPGTLKSMIRQSGLPASLFRS